jgi:hypothetical protein
VRKSFYALTTYELLLLAAAAAFAHLFNGTGIGTSDLDVLRGLGFSLGSPFVSLFLWFFFYLNVLAPQSWLIIGVCLYFGLKGRLRPRPLE